MAMYKLVALSGEDRGQEWPLLVGRNLIGRGTTAGIQIQDSKASRNHCVVEVGDLNSIEDLGSLNNTYLNGRPVQKENLSVGDRITVGDTEMVFSEVSDEAPVKLVTTVLQQEIRERKLREFERELLSHGLVGRSEGVQKVLEMIGKVARTDATVLITGASGSGKELVAGALHFNSHRKEGNFVSVNCAALPETLLESELFGYERGAFTGATASRAGKFQFADGGTIFLDEIGDMPPGCQAKILRVLQDRSFSRLGSNETDTVDCRIIAATNRDLEKAVEERTFREDLFYRLNVINIDIPPLAQRKEDIEILASHFMERFCALHSTPLKSFARDAVEALQTHNWPGNVRELQNCVERAVLLTDTRVISAGDLRLPQSRQAATEATLYTVRSLKDIEKEHVLRTLEYTQGNKKRAAEILGIERNTLYDKLRQYGLRE